MAFHGLTDELPKSLSATVSADVTGGLLPIGTRPLDWQGLRRPTGRTPSKIAGRPVDWQRVKPERFFGFEDYEPFGYPMRYTTPERTLLDGLQTPALSGGIANVLRAWARARNTIDLDVLVYQVERFEVAVLRQRVGYILDQLGLTHPNVERWRESTHRGGSSRLVGSQPFASNFDSRWNLSLNGPVDVLHEFSM
jgi:predicted transcriptional regulator of viral defense system